MRRLAIVLGIIALPVLVVIGRGADVTQIAAGRSAPAAPTPWPTWTPIPTPVISKATESPSASLLDELAAKTGDIPFEQCIQNWCEEYFNGYWQGGPLGDAVLRRFGGEGKIDYYWGLDSPAAVVNRDNFSARYRRRIRLFTPGIYRFHIFHDDGVKVLVNNRSIFGDSLWGNIQPGVVDVRHVFRQEVLGNQDLDIEILYFDHQGTAFLKFYWEFEPSCQIDPRSLDCQRFPNFFTDWRGEYFNSANFPTSWPTGVTPVWPVELYNNLLVVRDDRASGPDYPGQPGEGLYFDWGLGSPAGGISHEYFSVRWTRRVQFAGGFYRFHMRVDDGGRLWVDETALIDKWRAPNDIYPVPEQISRDIYLSPGAHTLRVEYQELVGSATIRMWWESR